MHLRDIVDRDADKSLSSRFAGGAWSAVFSTISTWMDRGIAALIFGCMDTGEGAMSSVSASNVQTSPATLPAAGEAARHSVSIAFVTVIAFCGVCCNLCETNWQGLASSNIAGWGSGRLVHGRRGIV